jgi:hypothetical protein
MLCRHVPSPCKDNDDEDEEVSLFVSPLANVGVETAAVKENSTLPAEETTAPITSSE